MKPLHQCPGCQGKLTRHHPNTQFMYDTCPIFPCSLCYSQYFDMTSDQLKVSYIRFYAGKFLLYRYFDYYTYNLTHITHVYSLPELENRGVSPPLLTLSNNQLPVDFNHIDKLANKLQTLVTFL